MTAPGATSGRRERDLAAAPAAALAALGEEVAAWGGAWRPHGTDGGELTLPVLAGLRAGRLEARAEVSALGGGSRLVLVETAADWRLQAPAVAILALAALASLAVVLWPFFPQLGGLLPLALVLAVAAWLFVVARLRNQGLEELLAAVAERLGEGPAGG